MAKRGVSRNPGYRPGSHWAICDSCGFQFRAEDLIETWDGRWVCDDDWEPRHPQDFLRVREEDISVGEPIRLDDTSTVVAGSPTQAIAGTAVAGLTVAGSGSIPSGTFNNGL